MPRKTTRSKPARTSKVRKPRAPRKAALKTKSASRRAKTPAPRASKKAASAPPDRETGVALIARDPVTAFATWEVPDTAKADAGAVLRVLRGEEVEREVPVSLGWRGYSIKNLAPGEAYRVELGLQTSKTWRSLGGSNSVSLPPQGVSETVRGAFVDLSADPAGDPAGHSPGPRVVADPNPGFAEGKRAVLLDLSTAKNTPPTSPGGGTGHTLSGRR